MHTLENIIFYYFFNIYAQRGLFLPTLPGNIRKISRNYICMRIIAAHKYICKYSAFSCAVQPSPPNLIADLSDIIVCTIIWRLNTGQTEGLCYAAFSSFYTCNTIVIFILFSYSSYCIICRSTKQVHIVESA